MIIKKPVDEIYDIVLQGLEKKWSEAEIKNQIGYVLEDQNRNFTQYLSYIVNTAHRKHPGLLLACKDQLCEVLRKSLNELGVPL
jgi:hypothetical protein